MVETLFRIEKQSNLSELVTPAQIVQIKNNKRKTTRKTVLKMDARNSSQNKKKVKPKRDNRPYINFKIKILMNNCCKWVHLYKNDDPLAIGAERPAPIPSI